MWVSEIKKKKELVLFITYVIYYSTWKIVNAIYKLLELFKKLYLTEHRNGESISISFWCFFFSIPLRFKNCRKIKRLDHCAFSPLLSVVFLMSFQLLYNQQAVLAACVYDNFRKCQLITIWIG